MLIFICRDKFAHIQKTYGCFQCFSPIDNQKSPPLDKNKKKHFKIQ